LSSKRVLRDYITPLDVCIECKCDDSKRWGGSLCGLHDINGLSAENTNAHAGVERTQRRLLTIDLSFRPELQQ